MKIKWHVIRSTFLLLFILGLFLSSVSISKKKTIKYPFQNHRLSIDARVENLISLLTLEEKAGLMLAGSSAIPRLEIPEYIWGNECLHGIAWKGKSTVFPQAIGLAATFDDDLIFRVASAISDEARAKYNLMTQKENGHGRIGLTYWSPNVNIFRDPRWGRGQETYGEDPYLTGKIGSAFVKGLQGNDPKILKVAACAKHFAVHNGPEPERSTFDVHPSQKDLYETYLPAFEMLVKDADVQGVMGAYNRVYGVPACASSYLLQEILREKWDYEGYILSDCGAINMMHYTHHYTETVEQSCAAAIKAGINLNCGNAYKNLVSSIEAGLLTEKELDEALFYNLKTRFKLGLFDPQKLNPYRHLGASEIHNKEHQNIALEAAQKSIVLLKNKNNVLPLKNDINKLYVVGPNATAAEPLLGNYFGVSENLSVVLEGIVSKVSPTTMVQYRPGCLSMQDNLTDSDWSNAAMGSDAVIAVMGISSMFQGEEGAAIASADGGDRLRIKLPQNQIDYLKRMRSYGDKPLIVIITGGSAMAIPEIHDLADAVLYAWYPGEEGGNAIADVIFGNVSPSGRLPVTFPKSVEQLPPYEDYSMKGRTYRYMLDEPLYPFGFGLSYTRFSYETIELSKPVIHPGEEITLSVLVGNKGDVKADEVVQLYMNAQEAPFDIPLNTLIEFQRISLRSGEKKTVQFKLKSNQFAQINEKGEKVLLEGEYNVYIGGSSPGERSVDLGGSVLSKAKINFVMNK